MPKPLPDNVSTVCGWYGEHGYCTDVDVHERAMQIVDDVLGPVTLTYVEAIYCDFDCHYEDNGIYIPEVDDWPDTMVVE